MAATRGTDRTKSEFRRALPQTRLTAQSPCLALVLQAVGGGGGPHRQHLQTPRCLEAARSLGQGAQQASGQSLGMGGGPEHHCHGSTFSFNWFYNFYSANPVVLIWDLSTDNPWLHTQAFLKELVPCIAFCMQINQPTMKVTEQSTKKSPSTHKPTAISRGQRHVSSVTGEHRPLTPP